MGQIFSQFLAKFFPKPDPEIRVGMLGLDNAGKTTILYYLKSGSSTEHIVPTVGFNVETIQYGRHALNIWDVSGSQPKTKVLWSHYNKNTKAIIFVIDAADTERLSLAAEELKSLWWRSELEDAVFLIYTNKQDLHSALNAQAIDKYLNLQNLSPRHHWLIQDCCALTGLGLWEGIQNLMVLYEEKQKKCSLRLRK